MASTPRRYNTDLTDKQRKFVEGVTRGLSNTKSAEYAGYSEPSRAAYVLMRTPRVVAALKERRIAAIEGDMSRTALNTIDSIMTDPSAPAQTRFNASKYVLELAGHKIGDDTSEKDLTEMDAEELSKAVSTGMQALSDLASKLEGHHIVDGQITRLIEAGEAEIIDQEDDPETLSFLD